MTELLIDQRQPSLANVRNLPVGLYVDGDWIDGSGSTVESINPATGEPLASVAAASADDVDLAVGAAQRALTDRSWQRMTALDRCKLLWTLADLIEANLDELAEIEVMDNGMPIGTARYGFGPLAVDTFRYMAAATTRIDGRAYDMSVPFMPGARFNAQTRREPVGVVAAIVPWNAPLLMCAWKLAPALAAGCTVVLKPAEQTPLSALRLAEFVAEAGFPPGVVNVLNGPGESTGVALVQHPGVDKIAFTGSTEVGRSIVRSAADSLKRVSLELGGKSPNIIFDDADIAAAVAGAGLGIFFNSGQNCAAGSRLLVQRNVYDDVVAGVSAAAQSMQIGNGLNTGTEIGPLVSQDQLDRVLGFVTRAQGVGADIVTGGSQVGDTGYFMAPTVVRNVSATAEMAREEVFGPVLSVLPFDTEEEALRLANDSSYGLAAGVWTNDLSRADRMAEGLKAGTVWVNTYNAFGAASPFGGYKQSGWGKELGEEVFHSYLNTKAVVIAKQ